jgi:hypothetical protein
MIISFRLPIANPPGLDTLFATLPLRPDHPRKAPSAMGSLLTSAPKGVNE